VLFVLALLLVLGGAVAAIAWYARSTYYVAFAGDEVAIYQGKPDGVLWFDPTLVETTELTRDDVPENQLDELEAGHEVSSVDDAHQYVDNLAEARAEQTGTSTSTTRPTTTTATTPATPTTTGTTAPAVVTPTTVQ
jgi:protein phosphatase